MSGAGRSGPRGAGQRVQLPLLDRLLDDAPERAQERGPSPAETLAALRHAVRRDLEWLLNGRRRWRSWPAELQELAVSPLAFGIPDITGGRFREPAEREALRCEIEEAIRRFETRFRSVRVSLLDDESEPLNATLRLRIEAMMEADPAPEPVAFDSVVDPVNAEVIVRARDDV